MRIGLVTDFYYPWIGGPAILLRNLGYGLAARGHRVSLLAPGTTLHSMLEQDGPVDVTRVRTIPAPFGYNLRVAPWPRPEVARWLYEHKPDVVHVHHPFPICATTVFEARRRSIPVVATNHTIPECSLWGIRASGALYATANWAFGHWITLLLRRCEQVVTPTTWAAAELHTLGYRADVLPISNGVDLSRFKPGPETTALRDRLGLDARPVVLFTGRLDAEKQMDVWLRAAAEVIRTGAWQFVIGGRGAERDRLERLVRELRVEEGVRFIGYVSDEELPDLYRLADIYFITSTVELQSISTLEAVASGLPVVAVEAGALPELVREGVNGRLIRPGDWAAGAEAIKSLLRDAQLRRMMGERSRAVSLAHDLQESVRAYEHVLLLAAQQAPGDRQRERAPVPGR